MKVSKVVPVSGAALALAAGLAYGAAALANDLGPDNTQAKHVAAAEANALGDPDDGGQVNATNGTVRIGGMMLKPGDPPVITH